MWNEMPPAVCQARTLPIVAPAALTSGIGTPPAGSRAVSQPAASNGRRRANLRIGFDLDQNLPLRDLRSCQRIELGNGAVERRGQRMLHLHRLKSEQALSFGNLLTL